MSSLSLTTPPQFPTSNRTFSGVSFQAHCSHTALSFGDTLFHLQVANETLEAPCQENANEAGSQWLLQMQKRETIRKR